MLTKQLKKYSSYSTIPLRIALGVIFIAHGHQKLFGGTEGTTQFFASIGIPLAGFFAVLVGIIEFFGGIALLIGFLTRYAAALIAIVMIVAIWKINLGSGLIGGYEFELALLAGAIALMLSGAGNLSVEKMLIKKEV